MAAECFPTPALLSPPPVDGVARDDGQQTRIATDGRHYTRLQFNEHYGQHGFAYWKKATIPPAGPHFPRTLQNDTGERGATEHAYQPPAPPPPDTTEEDYVKLQYMQMELHKTAVEIFASATKCARNNDLPTTLAWFLEGTAAFLSPPVADDLDQCGGSASECVLALRSTELLLPQLQQACSNHDISLDSIVLKNMVKQAQRNLRDLLVIRTQLMVPLERLAFEQALDVAHGYCVPRDSDMYSKIMQSYRKVIWERNISGAFPSKQEERRRNGKLTRRAKTHPKRVKNRDNE